MIDFQKQTFKYESKPDNLWDSFPLPVKVIVGVLLTAYFLGGMLAPLVLIFS